MYRCVPGMRLRDPGVGRTRRGVRVRSSGRRRPHNTRDRCEPPAADYYQECKSGAQGSFHNASGYPLIDHTKFPDMRAMTDHAHSIGLKMGWCTPRTLASRVP